MRRFTYILIFLLLCSVVYAWDTSWEMVSKFPLIYFSEHGEPGTPGTSHTVLYVKSNGRVYAKDDAGTEYDLTAGGGSDIFLADDTPIKFGNTSLAPDASMEWDTSGATDLFLIDVTDQAANNNDGSGITINTDSGGTGGAATNGGPIVLDFGGGKNGGYGGGLIFAEDTVTWGWLYQTSTGTPTLAGEAVDGVGAVGVKIGAGVDLTTAGAKIVSFIDNADTAEAEKAFIDLDGEVNCAGIDTSAPIILANDEVITNAVDGQIDFTDGTNVLMRIADGGLTGNVTVTGDLQVSGNTSLVLTDTLYGNLQMGNITTPDDDCGTFTMIKGAQAGDPQVQFALTADANGDFGITADTGAIQFYPTTNLLTVLNGGSKFYINATSTPQTQTAGALDIDVTTATDGVFGVNFDLNSTATTGIGATTLYVNARSSAVLTATNSALYGAEVYATKSGADTSVNAVQVRGVNIQAQNTGSTDAGTRETMGGYFSATGDAAGASTAYGIYSTATGADTNYAGYFIGDVYVNDDLMMGSATVDTGSITMIKGAQAGDPQVQLYLTSDANGDFDINTDTGDISLTAAGEIYLYPLGSKVETQLPTTSSFVINATTNDRTDTTPSVDINVGIDTTSATAQVSGVDVDVTRAAADNGRTYGVDVNLVTSDMNNSYDSACYKATMNVSNCTQATSQAVGFFAGAVTTDAQCEVFGFRVDQDDYDYSFYSVDGSVFHELNNAETWYIDASTNPRNAVGDVCTIDVNINSVTSDSLYISTVVGTNLSAAEIVNGINLYIDGKTTSDAGSFTNGIYMNSNTASGGTVTAIKAEGSYDNYIDFANFDVDANGTITAGGGLTLNRTAVTASTNTSSDDYYFGCDTVGADTITLQTADCVAGRIIVVKDEGGNAAAQNITIDTQGAETIDGNASVTISTNYASLTLISDGSSWYII